MSTIYQVFTLYRDLINKTKKYSNMAYPFLGLSGEWGEMLDKLDYGKLDSSEAGDVMWYIFACLFEVENILPVRKLFIDEFNRLTKEIDLMMVKFSENINDIQTFEKSLFRVHELVKKLLRDGDNKHKAREIVILLANMLAFLNVVYNIDIFQTAKMNRDKLLSRLDRGVIKGDGDER